MGYLYKKEIKNGSINCFHRYHLRTLSQLMIYGLCFYGSTIYNFTIKLELLYLFGNVCPFIYNLKWIFVINVKSHDITHLKRHCTKTSVGRKQQKILEIYIKNVNKLTLWVCNYERVCMWVLLCGRICKKWNWVQIKTAAIRSFISCFIFCCLGLYRTLASDLNCLYH